MADWLRQWLETWARRSRQAGLGETSVSDAMPSMAAIQREHPGLWVAVRNGEVVEVRENPHALVMALRERDITGATVFRCPDLDEPELVGLG